MRALRDELTVLEAEREDVVEHRVHERDVGARQRLQVNVSACRELDAPRIAHDELRATLYGSLERRAEYRMRLRRVGAEQENDVGLVLDLAHRA